MRTFLNLILAMGADDMEDGTMMKRSIEEQRRREYAAIGMILALCAGFTLLWLVAA